jgi:hypothetical protein
MSWASPALADGALFLRTTDHLFCIGSDAPSAGSDLSNREADHHKIAEAHRKRDEEQGNAPGK